MINEEVMLCIKESVEALERRLEKRIEERERIPSELKKELAALKRDLGRLAKRARFPRHEETTSDLAECGVVSGGGECDSRNSNRG